MNHEKTLESILERAEERAEKRALEHIYMATENVSLDKQKALFDMLKANVLLGVRLAIEEIHNEIKNNNETNKTKSRTD